MSDPTEKTPCRCPTDWCRLEPDNGAEYCPDLEPDEFCAYRDEDEVGERHADSN